MASWMIFQHSRIVSTTNRAIASNAPNPSKRIDGSNNLSNTNPHHPQWWGACSVRAQRPMQMETDKSNESNRRQHGPMPRARWARGMLRRTRGGVRLVCHDASADGGVRASPLSVGKKPFSIDFSFSFYWFVKSCCDSIFGPRNCAPLNYWW